MADVDLGSFLDEISAKDKLLASQPAPSANGRAGLPPVRGAKAAPPPKAAPAKKQPAKKVARADADAASQAIWDDADADAAAQANWEDADAAPEEAAATKPAAPKAPETLKPRQRKHAYEYFNQWDAYDVEAECDKVDAGAPNGEAAPADAADEADGLPPGVTAADLEKMARPELERRARNEKDKGNDQFKAGEYREALRSYTRSIRLCPDGAIAYANRGMCHLKMKQYKQAVGDCSAAIEIDDTYTKAYLRRGIARRRLGDGARALEDLRVVLAREPANKEAAEHERCATIEMEKAAKAREAAVPELAVPSVKRGNMLIEEVEEDEEEEGGDDYDEEEEAVQPSAALRALEREREDAALLEAARAAEAELRASERGGPAIDPQAMQESDELINSLSAMSAGGHLSNLLSADGSLDGAREATRPARKEPSRAEPPKSGMRTLAVEEVDDESDEEEVPVAAAAASAAGASGGGMRKMVIEEDDSEDDDDGGAAAPAAAAGGGMRSLQVEEVSDSEDEESEGAAAAGGGLRSLQIEEVDSEEEEEDAPVRAAGSAAAAAQQEREEPLSEAARASVASAEALRCAGNELFSGGRYESAIDKYTAALSALSAFSGSRAGAALAAKCLNNRASCECQLGMYEAAAADCTEVLAIEPSNAKALMRRGYAHEALERYADALADMRAVLVVDPSAKDASAACVRLSKLVRQKAALDGPAAAAPKAAAPKAEAAGAAPAPAPAPASAASAKERGTAAFKAGQFRTAAELYYEASKLEPECHTVCPSLPPRARTQPGASSAPPTAASLPSAALLQPRPRAPQDGPARARAHRRAPVRRARADIRQGPLPAWAGAACRRRRARRGGCVRGGDGAHDDRRRACRLQPRVARR